MRGRGTALRTLAGLATLAAALACSAARADTLTLRYVPTYSFVASEVVPADGPTTHSRAEALTQRLTLDVDKSFLPTLSWNAGGLLDWNKSWLRDETDTWTNSDSKRWTANTRLDFGTGPFRSVASYDRRDAENDSTRSGVTTHGRGPIGDTYTLTLLWKPEDLPRVTAAASRVDVYEPTRKQLDQSTNSLSLSLDHSPSEKVQLHYSYSLTNPIDRVRDNESVAQGHFVRVGWGDQFLDGRLSTYAAYQAGYQTTTTTAGAGGATRETRRLPSAGLSKVETFPDTPTQDTLAPTPALVDSDRTSSAGVNLGHSRTSAGDTAARDLGAQFPDDRPELNTVRVWVDRPLPPAIVAGFTWEAYRSDDNVTWTKVPIVAPVVFGQLDNRFEITIERTRARYVKVVTHPLLTSVSTDPLYSEILLTELEFYLVELLPAGITRDRSITGTMTGALRYILLREPSLTYDLAVTASHHDRPLQGRGAIEQSLGFGRDLDPHTRLSARVLRSDSFDTTGHVGQNQWGGALSAEPVPFFGWNLNYNGVHTTSTLGTELTNGVNGGVRADLYKDVSATSSASYRLTRFATGRLGQTATTGAGLTLTPHPAVTATGTFGFAFNELWGAGGATTSTRAGRLDGTVTYNPFPALYVSASGGRNVLGATPSTQTSVTAGLSLFQGGGLSVRFNYGQTSDSLTSSSGRTIGAGLGWTLARGRSLSVNYAHLTSHAPAQDLRSDAVTASLQIPAF